MNNDELAKVLVPTKQGVVSSSGEPPGFWKLTKAAFRNDSLISAVGHWLQIRKARVHARLRNPVPKGWCPEEFVPEGLPPEYREYLCAAQNPEELAIRKNIIIDDIQYHSMIDRSGTVKRYSAGGASMLLDPIAWVGLGTVAGAAGKAVGKVAARIGLGRIGTGMLEGAVVNTAVGTADTAIRRAMPDAQVQQAEYHAMTDLIYGAGMGAIGGFLSDAAGYSRFKLQHGSWDIHLYRAAELEARRLEIGTYPGLTGVQQLQRRKEVDELVQKFIAGEGTTSKYRAFDISDAVDKQRAIGKYLGVFGLRDKGVELTAKGMNRIRAAFSNHMTFLTSPLDSARVFGMRMFPTTTFESKLSAQVGDGTPAIIMRERWSASDKWRLGRATSGTVYSKACKYGFEGKKAEFYDRIVDICSDSTIRAAESNPVLLQAADEVNKVMRDCAQRLYDVGGFEWQKARKLRLDNELEALDKRFNTRAADITDTEHQAQYGAARNALQAEYDNDCSLGLDEALKRFGGSYFPKRLDVDLIEANRPEAEAAITRSMITGTTKHARENLISAWTGGLSKLKDEDFTNFNTFWNRMDNELGRYNLDGMFKRPDHLLLDDTGKKFAYRPADIHPELFQLNEKVVGEIEGQALERVQDAMDRRINEVVTGCAKLNSVNIKERVQRAATQPILKPRGSARKRLFVDNYEDIRPFLDRDLFKVLDKYLNDMNTSAAMIRTFGDETGERAMDQIFKEYYEKRNEITYKPGDSKHRKKELARLDAHMESLGRSYEAIINYMKGYGAVSTSELGNTSMVGKIVRTISNWNIARYLGDTSLSQLQDTAHVALRQNGWATFGKSIVNFVRALTSPGYRAELRAMGEDLGIASDLFIKSQRARDLIHTPDRIGFWGVAEDTSARLADTALKYSGTALLDTWTQTNAAYMAAGKLKRAVERLAAGKRLSAFQVNFLHEAGISAEQAERMAGQIKKYASKGTVLQLNLKEWEDKEAANGVRKLLYSHGSDATMVPGADLPPFFKSSLGRVLFQFRIFATSTFNKMFMYGLEKGIDSTYVMIAQCILLSTAGKFLKSLGKPGVARGKDPITGKMREFDAQDLFMRALDDSLLDTDATAWIMDPAGLISAIKDPYSSFGKFGGTTAALVTDIGKGIRAVCDVMTGGTPSESDLRGATRLLPFWNHPFVRAGIAVHRLATGKTVTGIDKTKRDKRAGGKQKAQGSPEEQMIRELKRDKPKGKKKPGAKKSAKIENNLETERLNNEN